MFVLYNVSMATSVTALLGQSYHALYTSPKLYSTVLYVLEVYLIGSNM